jgi:hypothetical protein
VAQLGLCAPDHPPHDEVCDVTVGSCNLWLVVIIEKFIYEECMMECIQGDIMVDKQEQLRKDFMKDFGIPDGTIFERNTPVDVDDIPYNPNTSGELGDEPEPSKLEATVKKESRLRRISKAVGRVLMVPLAMYAIDKAVDAYHGVVNEGPKSAWAGEKETVMKKVPGLDYEFDGGVYEWNSKGYKEPKFIFRKALNRKEKDIEAIFSDPVLFDYIGQHVQSSYKKGEFVGIMFNPKQPEQISLTFKINKKIFHAYKKADDEIMGKLLLYNKGH